MNLQQFKRINTLSGWVILFIASLVYVSTMESSASLWDCGEFIASSYKLQVVHPPGAPMFLMIGRMFSLLAMGDVESIAWTQNLLSALCSAFSIMFLFWITTHLARRMLVPRKATNLSMEKVWVILGAGAIAALSCTFTDSVWFSAVEAEVYSMSLLCTAVIFWAMMRWEEVADEPYADRWLLLISLIVGCSIFIHWLNLLSIPAMVFIYYFRRYEPSRNGMIAAFLAAIGIVGFILKIVITGFVDIAAAMELFFVNGMGMPFNTGVIAFLLVFVASLIFGLWYTYKNDYPAIHNLIIAFMFIMIGYSSIVTVMIRSNANPNIDMNSPEDVVSLASYLKREQYGSRPFLTGYYYTADVVDVKETGKRYQRGKDKYDIVGRRIEYVYEGKKIFFPRMWDSSNDNVRRYEKWVGMKKGEKPTFADNITFFLKYQIGHMYVRYFMWNFAGRQNDEQGLGGIKNGNWLSGIGFIDGWRLGSQANLPDHIKNHPSRNTYYFLPLLLGLLGLVFHFTNDNRRAFVIFLLFFFSGIAIIIQGNSPPIEPRERDYIFAGSFYAFTIWIGLGVVAMYDLLKSKMAGNLASKLAPVICLAVPLLMGFQGWDDHDRSGRYAARDFAANYLESCAPNSIIFTQGDNDTYPLWYAQEVEGIRRDVRVVNLSLLGVDWYINQLRRKVNDADPVPMNMSPTDIRGTKRDVVAVTENPQVVDPEKHTSLQNVLEFVRDDSKRSKLPRRPDTDYLPTKNLKLKADLAKVKAQGAIAADAKDRLVNELTWRLSKGSLYKNDLMVLDIIAANNWERPIYFAISVSPSSYLGLDKYFQLEGLAYRLMPIEAKSKPPYRGEVQPDIMYDNLVNKFKFGNLKDPSVHTDSDLRRMATNFRSNYARLAEVLIEKGDKERAINVLDKSMEELPKHAVPYDIYMYSTIEAYYKADAYEKANALAEEVSQSLIAELAYFKSLSGTAARAFKKDVDRNTSFVQLFIRTAEQEKQTELAKKLEDMLKSV